MLILHLAESQLLINKKKHNIRKARAGIKAQGTKEEWVKVKAKAGLIGGHSDCVQALKSKS